MAPADNQQQGRFGKTGHVSAPPRKRIDEVHGVGVTQTAEGWTARVRISPSSEGSVIAAIRDALAPMEVEVSVTEMPQPFADG